MKRIILLSMLLFGLFCVTSVKAQGYIDVDVAVELIINKHPIQTDAGVIDDGVTYDEAGLELSWFFITCDGTITEDTITPTDSAGVYDWTFIDIGTYKIELPASGGGTANNDIEGMGWFAGNCTATLSWSSPIYTFRKASHNDVEIENGAAGDAKLELYITDWATAYDGTLNMFNVDVDAVDGDTGAATTLETTFDTSTAADAWEASWVNTTWAGNIDDMFDGTGLSVSTFTTDALTAANINTEVDTALNTAIPGSPTANSINERLAAIDDLTQASGAGDLAAVLTDTGTTLPASISAISVSAGWDSTTVSSATSTSVFVIADGVIEDDVYNGFLITVTDANGDNDPEPAFVKDYISSTKTIILDTPLSFTPENGDTVRFLAGFGRGGKPIIFRRR